MARDSSRGMRTSLVVSRGTNKCILKFRLKLYRVYKPFSLKLQYRTKKMFKKTHLLLLLLVPRAPDSSRGMMTSLVVSRGIYKCILKFRLKLYKPFSLKLQYHKEKMLKKTHLLLLLLVPRAPDSSRGMRTSLVVSRGTYKCILKFRLKLYKPFSLKLQYRKEKMLKKHICCCYC